MGIFDVIELRNHIRSIGEYVFYLADVACVYSASESCKEQRSVPLVELNPSLDFIHYHLKEMSKVLDKYDKDS